MKSSEKCDGKRTVNVFLFSNNRFVVNFGRVRAKFKGTIKRLKERRASRRINTSTKKGRSKCVEK